VELLRRSGEEGPRIAAFGHRQNPDVVVDAPLALLEQEK